MAYRPTRAILGAAAFLALTGCGSSDKVDANAIAAEVAASADAFIEAFNSGDPDKAATYVAPDYVGMFHGQPNIIGADANKAAMAEQLKDPTTHWSISKPQIAISKVGDIAVYEATYELNHTDEATNQPAKETGNWVAIFTRQADGSMKLRRSIGTDAPLTKPPTAPPAAETPAP